MRTIYHFEFYTWPDNALPHVTSHSLSYIECIRFYELQVIRTLYENIELAQKYPLGPPICVHCTTGVGNAAALCVIAMNMRRLDEQPNDEVKRLDIRESARYMLLRRYGAFMNRDHYIMCYMVILEYAYLQGYLGNKDMCVLRRKLQQEITDA